MQFREVIPTDRTNIDKIAANGEDRLLLAKLWDKINAGIRRNVPASTPFLSPREQEMAHYLFGNEPGLFYFGGYPDAERKMLCYLPEYMDESSLYESGSPVVCLHAVFFDGDILSHRDFLGGLMGCGVERDVLGDILVGKGSCDFFVTEQISDYIQQNFLSAGRTKLHIDTIPLSQVQIADPDFAVIRDTLASLRLDSVISTGFRIGRSLASQYISSGKVAIDGFPCEKSDKTITEGMKISVRGLGKIKVHSVSGQTKKGRTWVVIHHYI